MYALRYHAVARHNVGDVILGDRASHRYRGLAVHHPRDLLVRDNRAFGDSRQRSPNFNLEMCALHEDAQLDVAETEDLRDDGARLVSDARGLLEHSGQRPFRLEIPDGLRLVVVVDERQVCHGFVDVGHGDEALPERRTVERVQQLECHAALLVLVHRYAPERRYDHDETTEESRTRMSGEIEEMRKRDEKGDAC